eukprot:9702193-Heterocapsa_arctica.AAC.1
MVAGSSTRSKRAKSCARHKVRRDPRAARLVARLVVDGLALVLVVACLVVDRLALALVVARLALALVVVVDRARKRALLA